MRKPFILVTLLSTLVLYACDTDNKLTNEDDIVAACEFVVCDATCVDTRITAAHCGACGYACKSDQICVDAMCQIKDKDPDDPTGDDPSCQEKGLTSCKSGCADLDIDIDNCGDCGHRCNANMHCALGVCHCDEGFEDSDLDAGNGCETDLRYATCTENDTMPCFDGDKALINVGICREGIMRCIGGQWSQNCEGLVLPRKYDPSMPMLDLNCNGIPDGQEDLDNDGYTKAEGDCCDDKESCNVENPELVNPGAMELLGDGIDNNCDGQIDVINHTCLDLYDSTYPASDRANSALALVHAMDLCMPIIDENSKQAGLIDFRLQSDPLGRAIDPVMASTVSKMENVDKTHTVTPQKGASFALLSSGRAMDAKQGFNGAYFGKSGKSSIPASYSVAHNAQLESSPVCPGANEVYDMASLQIRMRVPSNANGFRFKFRFFSVEYPRYLCTPYNDFFLTLLESSHPDIPVDRNISFDKLGNPVSVNNAFFTSCETINCTVEKCPKTMGCVAGVCEPYKDPTDPSAGTNPACPDADGRADITVFNATPDRGATAWLQTSAPVVPNEIITLSFYIWDTSDQKLDSSVILDDFEWLTLKTEIGTVIVVN